MLVPSELPLSTHVPISEGWTAEYNVREFPGVNQEGALLDNGIRCAHISNVCYEMKYEDKYLDRQASTKAK